MGRYPTETVVSMRARRRPGCSVERFVRTHVVVDLHQRVEHPLLHLSVGRGGLRDLRLQLPMHALMRAALLLDSPA